VGDIVKELVQLVSGIFGEQRWGKLFTVAIIIISIFAVFIFWDSATGDFTLRATEKKIALLSDLYKLEQDGIMNSAELSPLYQKLVQELQGYKPALSTLSATSISPDLMQFLGGVVVWVVMALMILFTNSTTNKGATFIVAIVVGVILGFLGTLTPDNSDNLANFMTGIGVQFGVIGLIVIWQKMKSGKKPQAAT
jgi:hypothetical protein